MTGQTALSSVRSAAVSPAILSKLPVNGWTITTAPQPKTLAILTYNPPLSKRMNTIYAQCLTDDPSMHCGGFIRTRAATDAGLMRSARGQIWCGSPADMCGYKLTAVVIGGRIIPSSPVRTVQPLGGIQYSQRAGESNSKGEA